MSEQAFWTHLQQHFEAIRGTDAVQPLREKGWKKLAELGLPSRSHEAFRYVPLRECYSSTFRAPAVKQQEKALFADAILKECRHSHLVFVDGVFTPELCDTSALPAQMVVLSLDEAVRTHGSFLQGHLARSLKEENDPFACINLALHPKGAFVYLPPNHEAEVPLQCLHIVTDSQPLLLAPRLHLVLGSRSRMRSVTTTLVMHGALQGASPHCHMPVLEISLDEGAHLGMLSVLDTLPFWHLETVRAVLKKEATLDSLSVSFGGKAARQSYRVFLKGENSVANLQGLAVLAKNHTAHTHVLVEHEAPHTRSMQLFKSVLSDSSQSSFEGKIDVRPEAQKTEAYQLCRNLLLSQGAIANSQPNLEIFADDVKASHGATTSQLDPELLFYLSARGIDEKTARHLLIGSFCREMIDTIPYDAFLEKLLVSIRGHCEPLR